MKNKLITAQLLKWVYDNQIRLLQVKKFSIVQKKFLSSKTIDFITDYEVSHSKTDLVVDYKLQSPQHPSIEYGYKVTVNLEDFATTVTPGIVNEQENLDVLGDKINATIVEQFKTELQNTLKSFMDQLTKQKEIIKTTSQLSAEDVIKRLKADQTMSDLVNRSIQRLLSAQPILMLDVFTDARTKLWFEILGLLPLSRVRTPNGLIIEPNDRVLKTLYQYMFYKDIKNVERFGQKFINKEAVLSDPDLIMHPELMKSLLENDSIKASIYDVRGSLNNHIYDILQKNLNAFINKEDITLDDLELTIEQLAERLLNLAVDAGYHVE